MVNSRFSDGSTGVISFRVRSSLPPFSLLSAFAALCPALLARRFVCLLALYERLTPTAAGSLISFLQSLPMQGPGLALLVVDAGDCPGCSDFCMR